MGCSEFSGTSKWRLSRNDFAIHFNSFEVGAKVACSAMGDISRKFATRYVEGDKNDVVAAKAGDMFDGTVRWIEDISNEERPYPKLVIELEDGNFVTCLVERSQQRHGGRVLGWAMIISPVELGQPHVSTWMQTWQSPASVVNSTLESALR